MPRDSSLKTVLIIGSGPIVIGQACEFDYSGTQAARALKEDGLEVVLINSNPATIMTDPSTADHIYLLPLSKSSIIEIISKHQIDAVLPTMGGQTALNLAMECHKAGVWAKHKIQLLGVNPEAIDYTEDREQFRLYMKRLSMSTCEGATARSFLEGKEIAQRIGFPLIIRPSYTLGGSGGSEVYTPEALDEALRIGLQTSPIHEILVEKSIRGWKEFELELLQDQSQQSIVVCTVENMDPVGIHTGDSITVAPAMTLPDTVYQRMRDDSIRILSGLPNFAGGCNVQFAVNPANEEDLIVIEVNPRVSRSSALASKATGYPIAKVAAQLAIGYRLDELSNQITAYTSALFEPTLDYVVVKIPRWNFDKFPGANARLGLQMKSVGEVMALGSNFSEALLKACHSLEIQLRKLLFEARPLLKHQQLIKKLEEPSWDRVFMLFQAFALGVTQATITKITGIDPWFLHQIHKLVDIRTKLSKERLEDLSDDQLQEAKTLGFSDTQIAHLLDCSEDQIRKHRISKGLQRNYRMVDTCSAEFTAQTPYYYSSFSSKNESKPSDRKKVIVLGYGPNRIGQGIEFDYCCVHGILAAKSSGYEAIMINCNPETVSTDFDVADKLYFEPLEWEYVRDIIELEQPEGVIVQLGGQTALKLAALLHEHQIPIFGTSFESLNLAEDRGLFSDLLKKHQIPYPDYGTVKDAQHALQIAERLGFPLLVRPSYVLGGQHMKIVINETELEDHVIELQRHLPQHSILLDHFLERAIEAEVDALYDGSDLHIMGIMQHIEPAGIHSGDSYAVLPPYNLGDHIIKQIEKHTLTLAKVLSIKGLINIQFAIKDDQVYVIEANPRASRTAPFICKAYGIPYVHYGVEIMLGKKKIADFQFPPRPSGYAIKEPVFSFDKFPNVNKSLGPEMKSTGETIYFIDDLMNDYFTNLYSERNLYLSR